jgi:hypothetical protein
MESLLSTTTVKPPFTVLTLAKSVFMEGPTVYVRELMSRLRRAAEPRPFYLIAHKCNSLAEVKEAVDAGANAIECDIAFEHPDYGVEFEVRHFPEEGIPIKHYLISVAQYLKTQPQVAMFYFDLKDSDPNRAQSLLDIIRTHLTSVVPVHVVISQPDYKGRGFFIPIKDKICDPGEGFLIDMHDHPEQVVNFFEDQKVKRYGYANGVFVVGVPYNIPRSIMVGVALKWGHNTLRWVGTFTLAAQSEMRDYIAKGVDGIMVNDVPALVEVFNLLAEGYRLRRATRDDDPFAPAVHPSYVLTVKTRGEDGAGTDADVRFELIGSAGRVSATIDASPKGIFEWGDTDHVTLIGKDVGTIQELVLSVNNANNAPTWFVDWVKVKKRGTPGEVTFNFYQKIFPNKRVKRLPA